MNLETLFQSTQFWMYASLIIPLVVGIYAHMRVTNTYKKYVEVPSSRGMTGREVAQRVMESAGIRDVRIIKTPGEMTDYYDPVKKKLALSELNYDGTSLAALGVAAHEAGHAIQHKEGYAPMQFRMRLVPTVNMASGVLPFVMLGGLFFGSAGGTLLLDIGIMCYLAITAFHLITLPVEFDASHRAKMQLAGLGIAGNQEMVGINKTLDAAGFTYVAAFLGSIINLIYLVMLRRERE